MEKKKKSTALVSSRVGTIGIFTTDECPNACRNSNARNVSALYVCEMSYHFLFFFTSTMKILHLINRRSVDIKYLRIKSIQLICIVFTPDINLSAPRVTYCRSSTIIFQDVIFFNEGTKAVNVEGV